MDAVVVVAVVGVLAGNLLSQTHAREQGNHHNASISLLCRRIIPFDGLHYFTWNSWK